MFCAYHGEDHTDGREFSDEHIVPYSLGGTHEFVIRICKAANNAAGTSVDGRLINTLHMALERISMNLLSEDATEPRWDFNGTAQLGGTIRKIRYSISMRGEPVIWVAPLKPVASQDGSMEIRSIDCDRADRDRIIEDIRRKLSRKYQCNMTAQPLNEMVVHTFENIQITVPERIDLNAWYRAFAKIALGTAYLALGEQYARSSAADRLREIVWSTGNIPLAGFPPIWPLSLDAKQQQLVDIYSFQDWHTIAMSRFGLAIIILFGKFYGIIPLADKLHDPLFNNDGMVYTIDPRKREFLRYTFGRFLTMKNNHK